MGDVRRPVRLEAVEAMEAMVELDLDLVGAQELKAEWVVMCSRKRAKVSDVENVPRRMELAGVRGVMVGILEALDRGSFVASADIAGSFYSWARAWALHKVAIAVAGA